ncbi:hypothetical protein FPHYL_13372 [Fusarium phyllophilum]|uniref:Uncharacterized protein n=1 Tax=Fusarium phyllophilum TaxID=47803 RepID=A0A8H5MLP9_9HYPO|nr:hypothetical protein FPHYL_13372 [Fusarium phyllophilum]
MASRSSKIDIRLESADFEPLDTGARRFFLEARFRPLLSSDMLQQARTKAIELQSKHLAGRGLREVSAVYFEYHVDVTIWKLLVKRFMLSKENSWPWNVSLDENDLSQGASPVFREWCQSQADPCWQYQGPAPQSHAEAEKMVLETIQRANELDREVLHLRRIARQWSLGDEASAQDHSLRDSSGTKSLEGRAIKRKPTGGEEQDVESLSNEDRSMSVSSSSKRARLDNAAAVDTSLKVEDSQDEPLVHISMVPPNHQNNRNNRDDRNRGRSHTAQGRMGGSLEN